MRCSSIVDLNYFCSSLSLSASPASFATLHRGTCPNRPSIRSTRIDSLRRHEICISPCVSVASAFLQGMPSVVPIRSSRNGIGSTSTQVLNAIETAFSLRSPFSPLPWLGRIVGRAGFDGDSAVTAGQHIHSFFAVDFEAPRFLLTLTKGLFGFHSITPSKGLLVSLLWLMAFLPCQV